MVLRPWGLVPMGNGGLQGRRQGEQAGTTHFPCSDRDTWTNQGTVTTAAHTSLMAAQHPRTGAPNHRCPCSPTLGIWTEVGGDTLVSTEGL